MSKSVADPLRLKRAHDLIVSACAELHPDDFQFTVDARGTPWDVYKVIILGDFYLVAIRIHKAVEIGYCCKGLNHSAAEIIEALNNQEN